MKQKLSLQLLALSLLCAALANIGHADDYLCAKKVYTPKSNKVVLSKALTARTSACSAREREILHLSAQGTLELITGSDGSGSGLDADTLDGSDSSAFATTASVSSLGDRVTTTEGDISTLQTTDTSLDSRLDSAESSISSLSSSVSTLQTGLTALDSEVYEGVGVVYVGSSAGYTTLDSAVTYVNTQTRDADHRWTIVLAPGVHTVSSTVTLPTYTSIIGRGPLVSIVRGSISSATASQSAVINLSTGSNLSNLGIDNTATSSSSTGVYAASLSASDESDYSGYDNYLDNVRVTLMGAGGTSHTGIYLTSANVGMTNIAVRNGNASVTNYGLFVSSSAYRWFLKNSTILSRDTAAATCASGNCTAIYKQGSAAIDIMGCDIYGRSQAVVSSGGTMYVKDSYLRGPAAAITLSGTSNLSMFGVVVDAGSAVSDSTSGTITCVDSALLTGTALSSVCG